MQSLTVQPMPRYDAQIAKEQHILSLAREIANRLPPDAILFGVAVILDVNGKQIMTTKKAK